MSYREVGETGNQACGQQRRFKAAGCGIKTRPGVTPEHCILDSCVDLCFVIRPHMPFSYIPIPPAARLSLTGALDDNTKQAKVQPAPSINSKEKMIIMLREWQGELLPDL